MTSPSFTYTVPRPLPRQYSNEEMNRGDGMEFHPCCGLRLSTLTFDAFSQRFMLRMPGGWGAKICESQGLADCGVTDVFICFNRIGDGRSYDYQKGDDFLWRRGWNFDPYTGECLNFLLPSFRKPPRQ
jgi:hypothetical protein